MGWPGAWIDRVLGRPREAAAAPLYRAIVARARDAHWYVEGGVPDTIDGRFDMIASILALVLLRLEAEPDGGETGARLTELFVDDMDGQLREIGIGDVVVGKHMGRMMSALGGRIGAYRDGIAGGDLAPALVRNLYRGEAPAPAALAHVTTALDALRVAMIPIPADRLIAGDLP